MRKILLTVSMFVAISLLLGLPSHVMAGLDLPPGECEEDLDCEDGVFCTDDQCELGVCVNTPDDGQCDDSNVCTTDTCDPGVIVGMRRSTAMMVLTARRTHATKKTDASTNRWMSYAMIQFPAQLTRAMSSRDATIHLTTTTTTMRMIVRPTRATYRVGV